MSNFLSRLVERSQGRLPQVSPRHLTRYEPSGPQPTPDLGEVESEGESRARPPLRAEHAPAAQPVTSSVQATLPEVLAQFPPPVGAPDRAGRRPTAAPVAFAAEDQLADGGDDGTAPAPNRSGLPDEDRPARLPTTASLAWPALRPDAPALRPDPDRLPAQLAFPTLEQPQSAKPAGSRAAPATRSELAALSPPGQRTATSDPLIRPAPLLTPPAAPEVEEAARRSSAPASGRAVDPLNLPARVAVPSATQSDAAAAPARSQSARSAGVTPAQPSEQPGPHIHVSIGRIEVRALTPAAPAPRPRPPAPREPKLSLNDYLQQLPRTKR